MYRYVRILQCTCVTMYVYKYVYTYMQRSHVDGTRPKYGCIRIKETLLYENVTKRDKQYVCIYNKYYCIVCVSACLSAFASMCLWISM